MDDITGRKYSKLTVIRLFERRSETKNKHGHTINFWECQCSCGKKEVFAQSIITGRKVRRCSACEILFADQITKNTNAQLKEHCYGAKLEGLDRSKLPSFQKYFSLCPTHFQDTFGRSYTPENAKEEYNKIMNFEPQKIQEAQQCSPDRHNQRTPSSVKSSIVTLTTFGTLFMVLMSSILMN